MIRIASSLDLTRALSLPLDPHLRALLARRAAELDVPDIAGVAAFTVIQPGDAVFDVEAALGFPVTGDGGFDWAILHRGGWIEACIDLGELAEVVMVPNRDDVDAALLAACMEAAGQGVDARA